METTVKTIKSFGSVNEIINYLNKIGYKDKIATEINEEINTKALIKYGSILVLYDPYKLLD